MAECQLGKCTAARAFFGACLLLFLLPLSLPAQSERAAAFEQALAHVEEENYEEALTIFQAMARKNPRDYEARTWVARVKSWQGEHGAAEELYREVLRDDPDNLEAALGLVDVLSWQQRYGEAERRLAALEEKHPDHAGVLVRRGRLARWQERHEEARAYFQQVLEVDPGNTEAQQGLAALRAETRYKLEAGYFFEEFNFAGNTNGQFVELLYHDRDRVWLLGRFEFQNKFEENNTRYVLGGTYRALEHTWLRAQAGLAPPGDTVIANQDYTLELTQGLHPSLSVGTSYRFLDFRTADVQVLTALVNWHPRTDLHLYVRYSPARTDFESPRAHVWNQNGWARLVWDAHRAVSPYVLFAVGSESFTGLAADQLGAFAAQTWGAGVEVRLTPVQGFRAGYYFQDRTRGNHEQGFAVSYFFRF